MANSPQYAPHHPVTIGLHWLMACMLCGSVVLGMRMVDLPFSPQKLHFYAWHKWLGMTFFFCALLRLSWRILHNQHHHPKVSTRLTDRENQLAQSVHYLLYGLMFAIPLSGWLMSSAKGVSTVLFGLWALPDVLPRNRMLGAQLQSLHGWLNYSLLCLVVLHLAAALKHHFINRDLVLVSMLPWMRRGG